jgi:hemerythrin-like domain-containing protein
VDVLTIIKKEHREVGALIDEADGCDPGEERLIELAAEIEKKLSLHLAIEERLFYAVLRSGAEEQEQQVDVFEAYTEHAVAKALIEMLHSGRKPDQKFKAELQVLGETVKHHVEEEESTVFGIAKKLLDADELEEIGVKWERAKQRATKEAEGTTGRPARATAAKTSRSSTSRKKAATTPARRKTTRR